MQLAFSFTIVDMKYRMLILFFLWTVSASGQNRILKSKMDSILLEIASDYQISDIRVKNVSEIRGAYNTIYKNKFQELYTNYMKYYIPGTTATILNTNQSGTTIASYGATPCN